MLPDIFKDLPPSSNPHLQIATTDLDAISGDWYDVMELVKSLKRPLPRTKVWLHEKRSGIMITCPVLYGIPITNLKFWVFSPYDDLTAVGNVLRDYGRLFKREVQIELTFFIYQDRMPGDDGRWTCDKTVVWRV